MSLSLADLPEVSVVDGSWRDVYVLNTTAADWDAMLAWIRTTFSGNLKFWIDGENAPLSQSMADILRIQHVASPQMELDLDGLRLQCRFIDSSEIELDLDPTELNDARFESLLGFLRNLGQLLGRNVYLSPENIHNLPLLVFQHEINRIMVVAGVDRHYQDP